jgi:RHS repeat-associated protein
MTAMILSASDRVRRAVHRLGSLLPFRLTPLRVLSAATLTAILVVTIALVVARQPRPEQLLLDCLEATVVPCEPQSFDLLVPVSGTPVALAYSSQRVVTSVEPVTRWLAETGLGGWTLDVVHRLDRSAGLLHLGDGTSERAYPVEVAAGPHAGRLAVADRAGDTVHLFDRDGRHLSTVDALDGRVDYSIEYADGRLSAVTDDTSGLSITHRDDGEITIDSTAGGRTRLTLDGAGRLTSIRDTVGAQWHLEPDSRGLLGRAVLPDGGSYLLSYDRDGRLVEERDPVGVTTRWRRHRLADGYSLTRIESSGASSDWRLVRSGDGAVTATVTGPDGLTTREVTSGGSRMVTWPDGTTLRMRLAPDPRWGDQLPRAEESRLAIPGAPEVVTTSSVEVSGGGDDPFAVTAIEQRWAQAGSTYTTRWDAATRRLSTTTPHGRTTHLVLDRSGRTAAVAWGDGYEHRVSYDTAGRPAAVEWQDGSRIDLGYLDGAVELTSPADFHHRVELDAAGRVSRTRISEVGQARVHRRDDGALIAMEPGDARARRLALAADGNPMSFTPGRAPELTTWAYDAHGRLAGRGGGQDVRIEYDAASRPAELSTGGDTFGYVWDGTSGQLASLDGGAVQLGFEYAGALLIGESWRGSVEGSVRTRLDELLRVGEIEVDGTPIPVDYDADGLLVGVGATRVVRDPVSGLVTRLVHGEVVEERGYDDAGGLATVEVTAGGTTAYRLEIGRDRLGRVVHRRERVGNQPVRESEFGYDRFGQLVEVSVDGRVTESYAYDDRGNRVRATVAGRDRRATVDDADRLLTDGDATLSYTDAGRLAGWTDESGTLALTYDGLGNLLQVEPPAGPTVSYTHDGRSRRVASSRDGVPAGGLLYLDGQRPAATTGSGGGTDAVFTYAEDILTPTAMIRGGRAYRIVSDHTGSPRLVIDTATGEVVQRLAYDSFGVVVEDTRPAWQPFSFGGGILDPASGLVRFGARDYDPRTGRWTAPDPLLYEGGDANLYRFAYNDPVNRSDPTGLDPRRRKAYLDCLGLAIGIAGSPTEGVAIEQPLPETRCFQEPRGKNLPHRPGSELRPPPRPRVPRVPPAPPPLPPGPSKGGWESWRGWEPPKGGWRDQKYRSWGWRPRSGVFGLACLSPYDCLVRLHTYTADFARHLGDELGGLDVDLPGRDDDAGQAGPASREPRFSCGTIDECLADQPSGHIKGEPHIRTLDGLSMSFQAAGEFVYLGSDTFEVQTRFEGEVGRNTRATATAVRVGSHTIEVHYDEVKADRDGIRLPVRIDGADTTVDDQVRDLDGAQVVAVRDGPRDIVYVESPDGWLIAIENLNVSQNIIVVARPDADVVGLAGTPNGDRTDDLLRRDGTVLPLATLDTVRGLYGTLAAEWRVRPGERLFTDTPAQRWLTDEFTALPDTILSLGDLPADRVRAARATCVEAGVAAGGDLEDCTYDVAVSGNNDWADQQADSHTARRSDAGDRRPADDPLFVAAYRCRDGDLAALLAGGADVTIRRADDGWTALMFASQRNCPSTVSMLLAAGADPGAVSSEQGGFALYLAAQNGRAEVVRVLLDAGAMPDQALPSGDTPLLVAAFRERAEVTSMLVSAGADPDVARADGITPIMAAAQEGDLTSLRTLIRAGADVNRATFEDGTTALHLSARDDDTDVVSTLLEAGAHVDKPSVRGDTALHYAATRGADGAIRILLAAGADPAHRNDRGATPADVADESVAHLFDP